MKWLWIFLIMFWITVIVFPDLIAYLLGWFLIFIGINLISFFRPKKGKKGDSYVKFWNYKIYR